DVGDAVRVQRVDVVYNVRFQPGQLVRSGTRLPDDIVITQPGTFRDEPRGLEYLPRVALTTRAGRPGRMVGDGRNGVGHEHGSGMRPVQLAVCLTHRGCECLDEQRVVEELPQFRQPWRLVPHRSPGTGDVLVILSARGVATEI